MIGLSARRLALIPSGYSGRAKLVHCWRCRVDLMLVFDERGRGTEPLEVHGYDLAGSSSPGTYNLKGGWIHATRHRCGGPGPGRPTSETTDQPRGNVVDSG